MKGVASRNLLIRKIKNHVAISFAFASMSLGFIVLGYILFDVVAYGIEGLFPGVFTMDFVPVFLEPTGGGLRHAIVGQALITLVAIVIGIPIGILTGVYLAEYGRYNRLGRFVSLCADLLVSTPSIIIGTFIFAVMVNPLNSFSGISGSIALALIVLPVVARITEEMLRLIPDTLREAAYALGAPQYSVILNVSIKGALSGIVSGAILAVARVSGETAPLLLTALNKDYLSFDMSESIASMTVTIYRYAGTGVQQYETLAWTGSLLITLVILLVTIIVRLISSKTNRHNV